MAPRTEISKDSVPNAIFQVQWKPGEAGVTCHMHAPVILRLERCFSTERICDYRKASLIHHILTTRQKITLHPQ